MELIKSGVARVGNKEINLFKMCTEINLLGIMRSIKNICFPKLMFWEPFKNECR